MTNVAISCVLDDSPQFFMQCWNWLASLKVCGTTKNARVFIHYIDSIDRERLAGFEEMGATLVPIAAFGAGKAAYCNKVRQLETAELCAADYVILSDTDVVYRSCPTKYAAGHVIRAKTADHPNPPEVIWRALLQEAGIKADVPTVALPLRPGAKTFTANFNGGFYVIPGRATGTLAPLWNKWARFCLDRSELLAEWYYHSDQLGFGLALFESGLAFESLDIAANFPTHLASNDYAPIPPCEIDMFHYHSNLNDHGLLKAVGVPWIDSQIAEVNERIKPVRRDRFDNEVFWNSRYRTSPELGSGVGSRGTVLAEKRALLLPYMRVFADRPVVDIGCGDLETTRLMPCTQYLGLDLSTEALSIAGRARPDWTFKSGDVSSLDTGCCDLAICLDVLIHQSSRQAFEDLLDQLLRISRHAVLVSGYVSPPATGDIVFYHRSLIEALEQRPGVGYVKSVGRYRDLDLLLVVKKDALLPNSHDITLEQVAQCHGEITNGQRLNELVAASREALGFFPSTVIRGIEYPWFADRLAAHTGGRVLDLGAGVNVLPLWLARQGLNVSTIDRHETVRDPANKNGWNEWGYLDYGRLDPRISSINLDATQAVWDGKFDAIYSVSVVEHMPAAIRRQIMGLLGKWLGVGGKVYLSVDLVPGSDDLWPLSEGKTVDNEDLHGTLQDLLREVEGAGLRIIEHALRRGIRGSRTDIAFIEAVLPPGSSIT